MALISPIGGAYTSASAQVAPVANSIDAKAGRSESASSFDNAIGDALDTLNNQQLYADQLARDAATGNLQSIEDYMMAATEAQLTTQLTVAFRNKAVEAFNEIMRMQV